MEMVKITIDDKLVEVPKGSTILDAAKKVNVEIPTLCHLNLHDVGLVNQTASCRACVVEVEGRRNLAPSCATPVTDGMVVKSNSVRALNARKVVLELLLSDHPKECLTCAKSGECELQDLSEKFGIREIRCDGAQSTYREDYSPSIIRDMDKCIMCRRCETMCNEVQTVGALSGINRGFDAVVSPAFEMNLEDSVCTYCGQCVAVCPTGALTEKDYTWDVVSALADPEKTVVVQVAPAVRAALGEEFGMEPGTLVTGKIVTALKKLGFDNVFDTDFAADLTIMEEASEFLDRLTRHLEGDKTVKLPILTSCCPAWVKFFEHQFPEMKDIPSTAKSPQQMFGAIAKSYYAEKIGVKRENMVVVSIMPCLAKKYEVGRDEFKVDGNPDVDISISTRELARMIKQFNIDFVDLEDQEFDNPLGESTGAGVIFGATGGVIEAAVRTAYEWVTKEELKDVNFTSFRGLDGIKSATVKVGDLDLNIGIAHGLGNARKLLEDIKSGKSKFHAIEIMACPGGCIGGGGQPYHHGDLDILKKRAEAIYREDEGKAIRKSHENPYIKELYSTYLGSPLGEKAHHLLHTHYFNRK
ncbi:NADH-dependent [FeFe] hydrogenase, group A6 [Haliovirga abyssi]|uniref:NADH:ubiquinone oxidoreductase n=1 Tax=Haliovirga abyssi TaxID=2996794 RepID=A0AAU9DBL7_9FUSO|nr:NADH-dependent [FeFe] hydrogenase, group A6 [Haliovirga abyssi]BDU50665.1 NADH:ubiquinone oxidoreductase [Haliovirga abyssi]